MKLSKLVGTRFKETPAASTLKSHEYLIRGGYIKNVGSGIFSKLHPAVRVTAKIEAIIREEMNAIDGQEVYLPVTMPASLWKETGRYDSVGRELLRFTDRSGTEMVLGMTHEEAIVHLVRDVAPSHTDYPFMVYQIQTKFRDEPRSRGGLIRVREFVMKDAYSFHTTQEDLEEYYKKSYRAYERIFSKAGIPETIAVQSDSGMMGGKVAHEFMLLSDDGEDTLVLCNSCDYRSNIDVSECLTEPVIPDSSCDGANGDDVTLIETPGVKTIAELCSLLDIAPKQTCKAVMYRKIKSGELIVIFIRGDLEVNEAKLRNHLKEDVFPDTEHEDNVAYGSCGPVNFTSKAILLFDRSLKGGADFVTGANKDGYHYTGLNMQRDCPDAEYFDFAKTFDGATCPSCKIGVVSTKNGIEVGNIFQLGTKYSSTMGMQFADEHGESKSPIMGCYGIGIGRLMASVCEASHDDRGPIWPITIAPWQVHICALRNTESAVMDSAMALYDSLSNEGIEVIADDRPVSAGFMFSDADLLGVPVRVVISPKTIERGVIELSTRDKSYLEDVSADDAVASIKTLISSLQSESSKHVKPLL